MTGLRLLSSGELAACAVLSTALSAQRADPVVAFVDVTVVPMGRERTLPGQTVVVCGDRIELDFLKIHPVVKLEVFHALAGAAGRTGMRFAGHVPLDVGLARALELRFSTIDHLDGYVEPGLTPYRATATGTRHLAAFFGTSHSNGTVAAGMRADMVLVDGNPLSDIGNTSRISGVVAGGRWLDRAALDTMLRPREY